MQELIGEDKYVRSFTPVDGEDYSTVGMGAGQLMTITSPDGVSVTLDPTGNQTTKIAPTVAKTKVLEMQQRLAGPMQAALQAYQAANPGSVIRGTETGLKVLLPYFATPQLAADFVELLEASKQLENSPP